MTTDAGTADRPPQSSALVADLTAGLVVFLVALPLCLGIALASNAPLFSGLLAGIIGGLVVGTLSGSHTSVSGPAAGLTAVVIAQISALGSFDAFLVAVFLGGVLQLALGLMRAGSIADFVPTSVIKGLLAAIGLILILKQIPHLLGYDADPVGEMSFRQPDQETTFSELPNAFVHVQWGAALIGMFSVVLMVLWERSKKLRGSGVPAPLVVVLAGVGINLLLGAMGSGITVGEEHLVQVPVAESLSGFASFLRLPDFSALANPAVYTAGVTIALVASLETLLNLEAVDKLDPQRRTSPPNRELLAQGVGNVTAGLVGALPVTSVIVRSSVNIHTGARTKFSAIFHGGLLLLCVALLPTWLNQIPLSCLAAVLIITGLKLASPKLFRQMWDAGHNQFLPFVITVSAILLTDLLVGILIGLASSLVFILYSNLRRPLYRTMEKHIGGDVLRIELANQVSFLNRVALRNALAEAPPGGHVLLDARSTDYIDSDILTLISEFAEETAPARGVELSMVGFKPHYDDFDDQIQYVNFATRELQESLTPDQVVQILNEGNERFRTGRMITRDIPHLRAGAARGRHPLAVVLSGSSSRMPIEMLFDVGLGELFCARTTGNTAMTSTLGSLEYACAIAGAKLIVVLGHTDNKAVRMAAESVPAGDGGDAAHGCSHLERIFDEIRKSLGARRPAGSTDDGAHMEEWIDEVSRAHVHRTMDIILAESPILARLAREGRIKLVGGMYDIRSGAVELSEPEPGSQAHAISREKSPAVIESP